VILLPVILAVWFFIAYWVGRAAHNFGCSLRVSRAVVFIFFFLPLIDLPIGLPLAFALHKEIGSYQVFRTASVDGFFLDQGPEIRLDIGDSLAAGFLGPRSNYRYVEGRITGPDFPKMRLGEVIFDVPSGLYRMEVVGRDLGECTRLLDVETGRYFQYFERWQVEAGSREREPGYCIAIVPIKKISSRFEYDAYWQPLDVGRIRSFFNISAACISVIDRMDQSQLARQCVVDYNTWLPMPWHGPTWQSHFGPSLSIRDILIPTVSIKDPLEER